MRSLPSTARAADVPVTFTQNVLAEAQSKKIPISSGAKS